MCGPHGFFLVGHVHHQTFESRGGPAVDTNAARRRVSAVSDPRQDVTDDAHHVLRGLLDSAGLGSAALDLSKMRVWIARGFELVNSCGNLEEGV